MYDMNRNGPRVIETAIGSSVVDQLTLQLIQGTATIISPRRNTLSHAATTPVNRYPIPELGPEN